MTTKSVHQETVRIVDEQMKDIGLQMQALDDFVTRARQQNAQHHDSHVQSLEGLSTTVKSSFTNIGSHFTSTYERVRDLGDEMSTKTSSIQESLGPLDESLRQPLAELRSNISNTILPEYVPTGETPQKVQYQYPTILPRTEAHETLLSAIRPSSSSNTLVSPSKAPLMPVIFNDATPTSAEEVALLPSSSETESKRPTGGLREINVNILNAASLNSAASPEDGVSGSANSTDNSTTVTQIPTFKKSVSAMKVPQLKKKASMMALEGRENVAPGMFSQSTGRRRSPRTGGGN